MATRTKHDPSLYRAIHNLRKGGLHDALGISQDEKIPHERVVAASHSKNPHTQKMGQMALNMSKFKH